MKLRKVLALLLAMLMCAAFLAGCKKTPAYTPGVITEDGYESQWLGIAYTAPNGMIMATEEEIKAAMQAGTDILYEEDKEVDADSVVNYYEMMATNTSTGETINIVTEKLSSKSIDEETYADIVKLQLQQMDGAAITVGENTSRTIAGIEFLEIPVEMEVYGITFYETMFLKKMGDRMVVMTCRLF